MESLGIGLCTLQRDLKILKDSDDKKSQILYRAIQKQRGIEVG